MDTLGDNHAGQSPLIAQTMAEGIPIRTTSPSRRDDSLETDWVDIGISDNEHCGQSGEDECITMQDRIRRIERDEEEIKTYWPVRFSPNRYNKLLELYADALTSLEKAPFDDYDQEDRVDYLLYQNYLNRSTQRLKLEQKKDRDAEPLLPFAPALILLCEDGQASRFEGLDPKHVATVLHKASASMAEITSWVEKGNLTASKEAAYRATENIKALQRPIYDLYDFFQGYSPEFNWWVKAPFEAFDAALEPLLSSISTKLAGVHPNDQDEIVGEAIGRDRLLVELDAEMIPYTPEELLKIASDKYAWCEREMKYVALQLGFGNDWKAALRHVQGIYVDPGKQPQLIKSLVDSATTYVKSHDLVTVPPLAEKWTMEMMSAVAQKSNPFFLGGTTLVVSYPTDEMSHADKLMSMRGNGPHMSKATAFHEMIPGHHLQGFINQRSHAYRSIFHNAFYEEGWPMYWELLFWDRGDFFTSPEDKVATLFWRMHRCARILFSIKFHLGQLSPQQCINMLVDMVGHERATAEGEVRRSIMGDYGPLYQAGYYLGAMQLYALRNEARLIMKEKEFHDRILKANQMPIELFRALIMDKKLTRDYKTNWRFYDTE